MRLKLNIYLLSVIFVNIIRAQLSEFNDLEKASEVDFTSTTANPTATANQTTLATAGTATVVQKKYDIVKTENRTEVNIFTKTYQMIIANIYAFITTPKVNTVLRNIATCVVNGAIELISFYFPAPLIPVIASLAGMVVPFEPVLMVRDKMPVNSYRRAFITALNTFLGNFDKYKLADNLEYDPYMTQRFNRRMMNYGKETTTNKNTEDDFNKS